MLFKSLNDSHPDRSGSYHPYPKFTKVLVYPIRSKGARRLTMESANKRRLNRLFHGASSDVNDRRHCRQQGIMKCASGCEFSYRDPRKRIWQASCCECLYSEPSFVNDESIPYSSNR